MDPITVALGVGATGFAAYTTYLRFSSPEKLGKLGPMRERFGASLGTAIHVVAYSLAPAVVGVVLVLAGLRGVSVL
jgi:hypothetical protein